MQRSLQEDFLLKETKPFLGGLNASGDKLSKLYDLVEHMQYLYVRVVKAKDLPVVDVTGSCDPYVEVTLGNYKVFTRHFERNTNPEWNQVFSVPKDRIQASVLHITILHKHIVKDEFIGRISFKLHDIPRWVPPDSPLAPQWYQLEDKRGNTVRGELMVAIWFGTQADESFREALHSDAPGALYVFENIRSEVYLSPRLWFLRVRVIEAQGLTPMDKCKFPRVCVKAILGNQVLRTRVSMRKTGNPLWNEDLLLVVAEPFREPLILCVEERVAPGKERVLGRCFISIQDVDKRFNNRPINSKWHDLENVPIVDGGEIEFATKIHTNICLEGGYHVLDECAQYSGDLRPTSKQLWKVSIGVLELGILNDGELSPMKTRDGRATTDAYCVAKYGLKWVRTRTIMDSFTPKWNEQYTWDVFDPCTVVTIAVFDNNHLAKREDTSGDKDSKMGKVRIRLSALESGKLYTHAYPLMVLLPSGVKKMGEIHLAMRFTCSSYVNTLIKYSQPLLPEMHHLHPLAISQLDGLRRQATQIISTKLSRSEPPLRKEVVEYMLEAESHTWSMRKSKANFFRIMSVLSPCVAAAKWFRDVCYWKYPITTLLIHVFFLVLVLLPGFIPSAFFLYLFLRGVWSYPWRPRHPPHLDTRLSHATNTNPDEMDEEFDLFPTSRTADVVRMRYDRLRSIAGRIQTVIGDLATQGKRLQNLLRWRDPRASILFVMFCFVTTTVLYMAPKLVTILTGFYILRHPRFRHKLPSLPRNTLSRLPSRVDTMLE